MDETTGAQASPARRERTVLGGRNALLVIALALSFTSTWLINTAVYPLIDPFAPQAQYAAPLVGGLVALALAFVCQYRPQVLTSRATMLCTLISVMALSVLMLASTQRACVPLAMVATVLRWVPCILRDVILGFALMGLAAPSCAAVLVCGYALRYLLGLFLGLCAPAVQLAAFLVCFPVGLALLWPHARASFARLEAGGTPADLSITNPLSFLPLTNRMFVAVVLFHAALGFSVTFGSSSGGPVAGPLLALAFFAALLARTLRHSEQSIDGMYGAAYLLALAGMLLVPALSMGEGVLAWLSSVLCEVSSSLFALVTWYLVASIGRRSLAGALPVLCMVRAARGFGIALGLGTGALTTWMGSQDGVWIALLAAAMAFCFVAFNYMFARSFSFDATVRSVQPLGDVRVLAERPAAAGKAAAATESREDAWVPAQHEPQPSPAGAPVDAGVRATSRLDAACTRLAAQCRLTARETDVLRLLARGRNAAYIQDELTLTRSTVKSYVSDVYHKLGVHSHQELIDLVEQG